MYKSKIKKMTTVMSCGMALLRGPRNSFDYTLFLTSDDIQFVRVYCHRAVLIAHSPQLSQIITGENYFESSIKLKVGYIGACLELLQYFYVKDPLLITQKDKVLELCALFEMDMDYFLIKNEKHTHTVDTTNLKLHFVADSSECVTCADFFKCLVMEKSKLQVEKMENQKNADELIKDEPRITRSQKKRKFQIEKKNT